MEGRRQFVKLLKWLQRRGFAEGKGILVSEFRAMRMKYGVTREELAVWLQTSSDMLAQMETDGVEKHLDGGVQRHLLDLVKQLPSRHKSEEAEIPVESSKASTLVLDVEILEPLPLLPPVEEAQAALLTESDERVLALMRGLDLTAPNLQTVDQRFQRFCDFWATEKKIKRFTVKKAKGMLISTDVRDAVLAITGGTTPQFLANWRLYRHVQAKSKHKMALDSVRAGDVSAVSALMDYDERGPAARGPKNKGGKKKKKAKKARRKSETSALRALSESNARLMAIPKVKLTGKKKALAQLKGAQEVQEAVGALKLRLSALKVDFSGDQRLLTLIEGITHAVDPTHLKLKQLVLRRATKTRTK